MTDDVKSRIGRGGALHPNYKGGWRTAAGYIWIGDVPRYHIVWNESHPDDPVRPGEVIHHINEIKDDDRPENLRKFASQSDHWKQHAADVAARRRRDCAGRFI